MILQTEQLQVLAVDSAKSPIISNHLPPEPPVPAVKPAQPLPVPAVHVMNEAPTMNPKPGIPGVSDGYWINTDQVEIIRQSVHRSASAQALYCALNWVMSDNRCETFEVDYLQLSKLCGLSFYGIQMYLRKLAQIGVITVAKSERFGKTGAKVTILGEVRYA